MMSTGISDSKYITKNNPIWDYFDGALTRTRTWDRLLKRQLLYQLSYKGGIKDGAPGGTRTPNLLVRSQLLYPIELQVLVILSWFFKINSNFILIINLYLSTILDQGRVRRSGAKVIASNTIT
jgi:hypothetical protein